MSKINVGDRVRVVADQTPEKTGAHLIGLEGTVTDIGSWDKAYNYRVRVGTGAGIRIVDAYREELERIPADKPPVNLEVPIGRLVAVDKNWPSVWQGTEGGQDHYGSQQVKITKPGPKLVGGAGIGSTYRLSNLTDISETWKPDNSEDVDVSAGARMPITLQEPSIDSGSSWAIIKKAGDLPKPITLGVGLERYTAGMPKGVEARHIMEIQGWYPAFCKGNILKYITRLDHKGQYLSDLNKIKTYAEELIRIEETKESK